MSTAGNTKRRKAFTDMERQRLRLYHHTYPSLSPQQLASWFESKTGRRVAPSSVHDILSDKYTYLDSAEATDAVRKKKGPQWAELEEALFKWWQEFRPRNVTGTELKFKANEIWQSLPACQGKKAPLFSDGWLSNWRTRHGLAQAGKAAEVNAASFDAGKSNEAHALCASQSVPLAHLSVLSTSYPAPLFTLPTEGNVQVLNRGLPASAYQAAPHPEPIYALPSTVHFLPAHAASSKVSATRVKGHRIVKTPKLTAPSGDATEIELSKVHLNHSKDSVTFDRKLWTRVKDLSHKCISRTGPELLLPAKTVMDVLEPIVGSFESFLREKVEVPYFFNGDFERNCRELTAINTRKAIALLCVSEVFRLQLAKENSDPFLYEDWFLAFVDHRALSSSSTALITSEEHPCSSYAPHGMTTSRPKGDLRATISVVSAMIEGGRVDISTKTFSNADGADNTQTIKHFQAIIAITPPAKVQSVPQTIIHLGTKMLKLTSIISTPTITYRNIRPVTSAVFRVARFGSSRDLQLILSDGDASISDCDPEGRSLINYALRGRNTSTLNFLLTSVDNVDNYEVNGWGDLDPLIKLLAAPDVLIGTCEQDKRLACMKMMLEAGADPSITSKGISSLESELESGTLVGKLFTSLVAIKSKQMQEVMKTLLDHGQPYINVNSVVGLSSNKHPLLYLAESFHNLGVFPCDIHDKIFLLLRRDANIASRDMYGDSCLQIILKSNTNLSFPYYQEKHFKDILMCMVTAGAGIFAFNNSGETVSYIACRHGHVELWREVLAECGYDPDEVFSLENDFCHSVFPKHLGMGVFATATPNIRSTKLSFEEYGQQRKSLSCVRKVYSRRDVCFVAELNEASDFWETCIETSDSEEYEWANVQFKHPRTKQQTAQRKRRPLRLMIPEGCPKLLHDGVPWKIVFGC